MSANPQAFRERILARLRALKGAVAREAPKAVQHDTATALGRKRNRNVVRNAQRRRELTPNAWKRTRAHFNQACAYCGRTDARLEKEHFVALLLGGQADVHNIVPADLWCNRAKSDQHPLAWLVDKYGLLPGLALYNEIAAWLKVAR